MLTPYEISQRFCCWKYKLIRKEEQFYSFGLYETRSEAIKKKIEWERLAPENRAKVFQPKNKIWYNHN